MLEQRQHLTAVTASSFNFLTAPQNVTHIFDTTVSKTVWTENLTVDHSSANAMLGTETRGRCIKLVDALN